MRRPLSLAVLAAALATFAVAAWPASGQPQPAQPGQNDEPLPPRGVVIDIDSPERALYKIAIPNLRGDNNLGPQGAEVIRNDLKLVSLFSVLDTRSLIAD